MCAVSSGGAEFGTLVFGTIVAHDDRYAMSSIDCGGFDFARAARGLARRQWRCGCASRRATWR